MILYTVNAARPDEFPELSRNSRYSNIQWRSAQGKLRRRFFLRERGVLCRLAETFFPKHYFEFRTYFEA